MADPSSLFRVGDPLLNSVSPSSSRRTRDPSMLTESRFLSHLLLPFSQAASLGHVNPIRPAFPFSSPLSSTITVWLVESLFAGSPLLSGFGSFFLP